MRATPPPTARPAEWEQRSRTFEQTGIAEPFKGITADGRKIINRIETARLAGLEDYSASLSPEQRARLASALSDLPHRS